MSKAQQVWNASHYDHKLGFVSKFGEGILSLLNPQAGQRILDLGCGSGDLTTQIAASGADVIGLDYSSDMLEQAKAKFPELTFIHANAEDFQLEQPVHAVFSNAALHWMKDARGVVRSIRANLVAGGKFVAEFGGKDNMSIVISAIAEVLAEDYQLDVNNINPWYFPSIGQYSTLLEEEGFYVQIAEHFERNTAMPDGECGIYHWLDGFASLYFASLSEEQRQAAYYRIAEKTKDILFVDGTWYMDYKRIRVIAYRNL